jgi:hypothetical protein
MEKPESLFSKLLQRPIGIILRQEAQSPPQGTARPPSHGPRLGLGDAEVFLEEICDRCCG